MTIDIGVVMDPIAGVRVEKDSTFAMMLAAQRRGWRLWHMEMNDLRYADGAARARMRGVRVQDDPTDWFELGEERDRELAELDVVLMRKDPPFDMEYIVATYLLEAAGEKGCLIVNDPQSLRDANEKVFTTRFPDFAPAMVISREKAELRRFLEHQGRVVLKPLDGMGGRSIFVVERNDQNFSVIVETLTDNGQRYCMAQAFIPEIVDGDKRLLMIDGEPVPYVLARIPRPGEARGNLAAGGRAEPRPMGEAERRIAEAVGPELRRRGILFAGLDIIGEHLTEVNVTSPTCIRELDKAYGLDIAGDLMDRIEEKIA